MNKYTQKWVILGFFFAICYCNAIVPQAYALKESTGSGGSNAIAVHQLGETGEGVNIGLILYRNARTSHEAFTDVNNLPHAFNYDFSGDGISIIPHDTQLAGIISSRGGVTNPNDIGIAPGADIHCARVIDNSDGLSWNELDDALQSLITTHNCRIIVSGFELEGIDPNGDSTWTILYDYYAYQYGVIFANAAGNQNSQVTIFGDAYNGITTGGLRLNDPVNPYEYRRVGSISGSGLTLDGRRKPDITAPSEDQTVPTSTSDTTWVEVGTAYGETSYSGPHTAGAAALLLGFADKTLGPNDNSSEVIKAVLVDSAMPNVNNKLGAGTNPADSNNTWQKDRGYGRLDILRAYQTLDTSETEPNVNIIQDKGWGFGTLGPGQFDTYTVNTASRCRLISTLTWQRRIEWVDKKSGFPPAYDGVIDKDELHAYLANLDMIVYGPNDSNAIFSETLFSLDPKNNLEKCDLLILTPGNYTIVVDNNSTNGETADYGWAFELHPVLQGDIDGPDYAVDINDLDTFMQDWLVDDSQFDWILSPNEIIDFADFAKLADYWLQIDPLYYQY